MKSMTKRPSEKRPEGAWKCVSPLGNGACPNAAESPPVSEFESPKLNTAGNRHVPPDNTVAVLRTNVASIRTLKRIITLSWL